MTLVEERPARSCDHEPADNRREHRLGAVLRRERTEDERQGRDDPEAGKRNRRAHYPLAACSARSA